MAGSGRIAATATAAATATGPGRGRLVVITGGSSGIGRCSALRFARAGWSVGLVARGAAGLNSAHAAVVAAGARGAACVADVTDGAALEAAAAYLEDELGPVEVWVNCAGNGVYGAFLDVPEAEFRLVTEVTYLGTVNGTRVALRRMAGRDGGAGRGVVVNVCSAIAFHGLPMLSSYSGAKQAVRGFTESVRHELVGAGSRVRLAVVYPPAVNTPFFSRAVSYLPLAPRPARPVYQPEVVAAGVMRAAMGREREVLVSGVTAVFALACRVAPWAIDRAIQRLGAEGQMTACAEVARLRDPTLHGPSGRDFGVHGPFGAEARRWSAQMWVAGHRGWVWVAVGVGAVGVAVWAVAGMQPF